MFNPDFYPTPPDVAATMLDPLDLRGKVVVEPSAGSGNLRDFYPQHAWDWRAAQAERAEAFRLLQQVSDYAEAWELHAMDHKAN
jgi:hypothetical protein